MTIFGQYGEGFKAPATCLLRDHGVTPLGVSGTTLVHVRLNNAPISRTKLRPLVYDFYTITPAYQGALLILPACSPLLARQVQHGMAHFFFDQNPLLGSKIWESWDHSYALYHACGTDGHIFYCRLKRATIAGLPVIPVIHKANNRIDKKVQQDRDRNAFEDSVLSLCYDVFARRAATEEIAVLAIVSAASAFWERGHPLLSALASHRHAALVTRGTKALFGNKYYAASTITMLRHNSAMSRSKRRGR